MSNKNKIKIKKIPTVPMDDSLKYNYGIERGPKDNVKKPRIFGKSYSMGGKIKGYSAGGKVAATSYKSCGANIIGTK